MTDDDTAVLLRSLDSDAPAPSTVDIDRAVRDGRRRVRRVRVVRAGSAVAAAVLVLAGGATAVAVRGGAGQESAAPNSSGAADPSAGATGTGPTASPSTSVAGPAAPTRCEVSLLPIPDGVRMAIVTGADPSGRLIVGRSYPSGGERQVLLWRDGTVTKVPLDGDDPSLHDVNTAGLAVGGTFRTPQSGGESRQVPVAYLPDGRLVNLAGVTEGVANAVNDAGVTVGESARRPVRWASPRNPAEELPLPAGASTGEARDIDEDGTVVGFIGDGTSRERPYVWRPDGTHGELPTGSDGSGQAGSARAYTIRNGWVTGIADGGTASGAMRWNVHTNEVRVFAEFEIRASMANAAGWQVGTDPQGRGLLLTPAGPLVLPDLAKHAPGDLTNIPQAVSDDGRTIAGQADDSDDVIRAVVWRCG